MQQARWALFLSANYIEGVCTRAACGAFERTGSTLTIDFAGNYHLTDSLDLFARVENLTREQEIVGRQPYGARPNKDRTASLGVRIAF